MARPLLALGGIVLIGIGLTTAFGWGWGSSFDTTKAVDTTIRSVRLDGDAGSIRIRTGTAGSVHQHISYHWRGKPDDAFRVDGDQLVLADCGTNCSADFDVVVPAGVQVFGKLDSGGLDVAGAGSVDVQAASGHATVADVSGPVKLRLDSGSIDLHNVGEVQLHNDSGSVRGEDVRGPADVKTDSGSIRLKLTQAADVTAKTDSGSIDLTVPDQGYRVQGDSDSGHRRIDVRRDDSAAHTLDLTTDSGSVTVRAA